MSPFDLALSNIKVRLRIENVVRLEAAKLTTARLITARFIDNTTGFLVDADASYAAFERRRKMN